MSADYLAVLSCDLLSRKASEAQCPTGLLPACSALSGLSHPWQQLGSLSTAGALARALRAGGALGLQTSGSCSEELPVGSGQAAG